MRMNVKCFGRFVISFFCEFERPLDIISLFFELDVKPLVACVYQREFLAVAHKVKDDANFVWMVSHANCTQVALLHGNVLSSPVCPAPIYVYNETGGRLEREGVEFGQGRCRAEDDAVNLSTLCRNFWLEQDILTAQ